MILVPIRSISRDEVERAMKAAGYELSYRAPRTGTAQSSDWARGAGQVAFSSDLLSGLSLFLVLGDDAAGQRGQLEGLVPCERVSELVQRERGAAAPGAQARAALRFRELARFERLDEGFPRAAMAEAFSGWLVSEHRAVRTAAAEALFSLDWPELDGAVEAMAALDPALAWVGPWWKKSREASEKAAREEAEKQAKAGRQASLNRLVSEQRWDEALSMASKVLEEEDPPLLDGLRARALALEGLGRPWEALFWACVWASKSDDDDEALAARDRLARPPTTGTPDLSENILIAWKWLDDDDPITAALEAMRGLVPGHERAGDLGFFEAVFLLKKSFNRQKQRQARELLEPFLQQHPALAEGLCLLALARAAHDDRAGAEEAYRKALRAPAAGADPRTAPLAAFARRFEVDATGAAVLGALREMYRQASDHANSERIATEELAQPGASRADALRARGIARTFLERHGEAIADYRAALEAGDPDRNGLLHFNLACELAFTGQKDEALATLEQAITREGSWAKKAQKDSYFSALWADNAFVLATAGLTETPTPAEVERWITRSLGHSMDGRGDRAIEEGERAVAGAILLEDRALQARALGQLGAAQTGAGQLAQANDTLARAERLAREVFAGEPLGLARTLHSRAAALHADRRFDEAEAAYHEALSLREQALGPVTFEVAITLGDLGRLACDRGRLDDALALQVRCRGALEGALPALSGDDRLDVLLNLALNEGNRASTAQDAGRGAPEVLTHSEAMAGFLEQLVQGGGFFGAQTIPRLRRVLAALLTGELSPELSARTLALSERLLVLEYPDPRVRAEKLYWATLRAAMHELIAQGVDERAIAASIARAVRGQDPGEPVASHPAFKNLAAEFAARLTAGGDLVMVAMSLDLAASGAQPVAEAIGGLESFALANLAG